MVLVHATWGAVFIILRHLNAIREQFAISVWEIVFFRFVPASLLLVPVVVGRWSETKHLLRQAWWPVFWIGTLTTSLYNFLLITGEERVPASVASLVIALSPSATFILSFFFLHEQATFQKLAGLALSTAGLVCISALTRDADSGRLSVIYLLITIAASVSWSIATVIGKRVLKAHSPLLVTAVSMIIGSIPLVIVPLFHHRSFTLAREIPVTYWVALAYLVLLPTVFGFLVFYKALEVLKATQVSVFVFLVPLFGVMFAGFYEPLNTAIFLGGPLILAGVMITNRSGSRET